MMSVEELSAKGQNKDNFVGKGLLLIADTLLEKFWRISLYLTDDAIAKLYVTESFVKYREMVNNFIMMIQQSDRVIS